jgi:hypothetical protein
MQFFKGGDQQEQLHRRDFRGFRVTGQANVDKFKRTLQVEPYTEPHLTLFLKNEAERIRREEQVLIVVGGDQEAVSKTLKT